MKKFNRVLRFAFLVVLLGACASAWAIVNGKLVSDEQFAAEYPWAAVAVNTGRGGICGGTLIAPRWVLTAAHCARLPKHVLVGHAKRQAARRVEVERARRHPGFSGKTLQYDVGLLYLAEAVDLPVGALPTPGEARLLLLPGAAATLTGWGKTELSRQSSDRLVEGQVRLNGLVLNGSQIRYSYKGGGPCHQDSGSQMIMTTLDGRKLVVGVASGTNGNLCAKGGGGATYTNIAAVRDFIDQHVSSVEEE